MHLPDGRTYAFSKSNGVYTAADDIEISLESYGVDQWNVSRPGGSEWIFNNDGLILSMSDGKGNSLTLDYLVNIDTGVKYLSEIEHSNGASLYLSYTNFPMRSTFLDGLYSDDPNWIVTYDYDSSGRLSDSTHATLDNKEYGETYLYEDVGFCLTQRVNAAGTTFNYTYADIERNGVEQRFGASTWLDDNAFRTDFNYHPNNVSNTTRVVAHRAADDTIASLLTWDQTTWQVTSEINEEDGSGYELIYNDDQNLTREAIFHNGVTSSVARVYDSRHNVLREAAALGSTPVYTENAQFYEWHPTLSLPTSSYDTEGITNRFAWSTSGLLLKAYDTLSTNTFGYTGNGQISAATNANGNVTLFSYDNRGHHYLTTPAAGPQYRTLFDSNGFLTNSALPAVGGGWKSTTCVNDTYGRLRSTTCPDGISDYVYRNAAGVITGTVDRAGNRTAYTHAAGNKLTSVTNWLDASTPVGISFNYDWQMNNLTVINPMGYAVETYILEAQERVENVTNLEGQSLDVTYLVGDLVSSIDRFDGVIVSNLFNTSGNITQTLHDGISIEQAAYRKNGQLLSISNAVAGIEWNHDIRGFATNAQTTVGSFQTSVSYQFDPVGNVTGVLWNVGSGTLDVVYDFDEAERLRTINPNPFSSLASSPFKLIYNPYNGALNTLSNENIKVDYAYNILDAVTNTVYRDGSDNIVASFDYKQDVLGLITQKVSIIDGIATTNSYIFDNLGRLLSEHTNPAPQTPNPVIYSYDLAGNRLTAGSSTYTYTHNKLDGVLHDATGNITNMVQNGISLDPAIPNQEIFGLKSRDI